MSEFKPDGTLGIEDKVDHPQRVKELAATDSKYYYSAEELNAIKKGAEELNKTKASKEHVSAAAKGFDNFSNPAAADAFFITNPPAVNVLFVYTDPGESKAEFYRRASDNTTQLFRDSPVLESNFSQKAINSLSYSPIDELDLQGIASFSGFSNWPAIGQLRELSKDIYFDQIKTGLYLSSIPSTYDLTVKVFVASAKTSNIGDWSEIFTISLDETSNLPIANNELTVQLPETMSLNSGQVVYVVLWSPNNIVTCRRKNVTIANDRFLISNNGANFPTSFIFADSNIYGSTGINFHNTSYPAKKIAESVTTTQSQEIIDAYSKYSVDSSSDLVSKDAFPGTGNFSTLIQLKKFLEPKTFNRVEAGLFILDERPETFTFTVKVFTGPYSGVVSNLTEVFSKTYNQDSELPFFDDVKVGIDLGKIVTVKAQQYVYVAIWSPDEIVACRFVRNAAENGVDRFMISNNFSSFPTNIGAALIDTYGSSGVNLYNINNLTSYKKSIDDHERRLSNVEEGVSASQYEISNRELAFSNKLFLIAGQKYTLYKASIIRKLEDILKCSVTFGITGVQYPRFYSGIEDISFEADEVGSSAILALKDITVNNRNYQIPITVSKAAANAKAGQTIVYNAIGDSLTNRGVAAQVNTLNIFLNTGMTITNIGTVSNSGVNGEGRECWTFANFIGKSNIFPCGGQVIYSPFLKLATAQDKADHPEWCFQRTDSSNELSLSQTTDTGQNFYIFDYAYYLSNNSLENPTHISISLGTNDLTFNLNGAVDMASFAIEIMVTQMKVALPNVEVGVVTGTAKGDNTSDAYRQKQFDMINAINAKINSLALVDVESLPVFAFQNSRYMFPYTSGNEITSGNYTRETAPQDNIHFRNDAYKPYAQVLLGWILNK